MTETIKRRVCVNLKLQISEYGLQAWGVGWALLLVFCGEGRPHQQLASNPPIQPHLRSGDELAVQDLGVAFLVEGVENHLGAL